MNWRFTLGLALFVIGIATLPFGWWLSRIYYYAGLLLGAVGAVLCFSAYRNRRIEDDGWTPPNDPIVPVVGEARGFKGRDALTGRTEGMKAMTQQIERPRQMPNKRVKFARFACPTRKSDALSLAAYAQRCVS